jgi:hypothetical protein
LGAGVWQAKTEFETHSERACLKSAPETQDKVVHSRFSRQLTRNLQLCVSGLFTLSVKDAVAPWNSAMSLASGSGLCLAIWIKAKQTRTWFYPEDSFGAMEK